ncbi:hypothetical protein [Sphingomonas prati]|uniref:Uncharacterized protein n=1 Tax=Sphingomonas prati TaxID=1843237 RepID=A0A7W9BUQ8_9SPHN|nr:hypothetical protein [Sphingomonas prati]MBB5730469.1 hypothetical protein [Sphingomonas prati]
MGNVVRGQIVTARFCGRLGARIFRDEGRMLTLLAGHFQSRPTQLQHQLGTARDA